MNRLVKQKNVKAALCIGLVCQALLVACTHQTEKTQRLEPTEKQKPAPEQAKKQQLVRRTGSTLEEPEAQAFASSTVAPGVQADMQRLRHVQPLFTNRETYQQLPENGVKQVVESPVSTFSIDVDTGSYTNVRRMLNQGLLPPGDAVRVEEFINYFDYQYPLPEDKLEPFRIDTSLSVSPWNAERHLLRIGLKGHQIEQTQGANLVFLVDVSGSMHSSNKLPLLKKSLTLLSRQLDSKDRVSVVVYAGAAGVVLPSTPGDQHASIAAALDNLQAGGSTHGSAGIQLAYKMAQQGFIQGGVNRVILATDGDFNLGTVDHQQLIDLIKREKEKGIALTTLGFGQGNYNDHLMEQLADAGNGNYAYIDTLNEARKVLVDELQATMQMIAKDVKIQVEFNPQKVAEYRLIGYENRLLAREDFNNDKVDAGDVGAGHSVTAFYELTLTGSEDKFLSQLRYQSAQSNADKLSADPGVDEIAFVQLRYKLPQAASSQLLSHAVRSGDIKGFEAQQDDFRFASSVVGFAHLLKQSKFTQGLDYQQILDTANGAKGADEYGYRGEFVQLVRMAMALQEKQPNTQAGLN